MRGSALAVSWAVLSFRLATSDDIPAIRGLVESAYRGEASEQGWTSESHLLGGQRIDDEMLVDLLATPGACVVLAHRDGELVACCELRAPGRPVTSDPSPCEPARPVDDDPAIAGTGGAEGRDGAAYFGMFAVDPTIQGGGIGRILLAEAERIAATDLGAARLEMTVIEQRRELVAWYERRGYERTGETKPFPYGDERFGTPKVDDLVMVVLAKSLS